MVLMVMSSPCSCKTIPTLHIIIELPMIFVIFLCCMRIHEHVDTNAKTHTHTNTKTHMLIYVHPYSRTYEISQLACVEIFSD